MRIGRSAERIIGSRYLRACNGKETLLATLRLPETKQGPVNQVSNEKGSRGLDIWFELA